MKSVFEFLDYRSFLKYLFEEKKKLQRFFSHRFFLRRAGVKNSGFLSLVMEGKRNLTPEMTGKFNLALKFNDKEGEYFRNLVLFTQAKTSQEKEQYYKALKILGDKVNQRIIGAEINDYFEHWYNPVIRELVCQQDFKDDYIRLAESVVPAIGLREAKRAVETLQKIGMIAKDESGRFVQSNPAVIADSEAGKIAVRGFNRKMIGLAAEAIDKFNTDTRYIRGLTVGVSRECYNQITGELAAVNERIVKLVDSDKGSGLVYQLNVQFFPVSNAEQGANP